MSQPNLTADGTTTLDAFIGKPYTFGFAGDFGGGSLAVNFVLDGVAAPFQNSPVTAPGTFVEDSPGTEIQLVLTGSTDPDIVVSIAQVDAETPEAIGAETPAGAAAQIAVEAAARADGDKDTTATAAMRVNSLASAYILANSITDVAACRRILNCMDILETGSLVTNLVDAAFLRTAMQSSATSPKSLKGLVGASSGTPALTTNGLQFASGTTWAAWTLGSNVTAFTLAADIEGVETGQTSFGWLGGVVNSAGIDTGGQGWNYDAAATSYGYSKQGGTATTTSAMADNGDAQIVAYYNPIPQIFAWSYDGAVSPTLKSWVNGINNLTDSTGNTQTTSSLNRVVFGARHQNGSSYTIPWRGKLGAWMLFDRVLTDDENVVVARALRALDPRRKNFITAGDSLTSQFASQSGGLYNWPSRAIRLNTRRNDTIRLCNAARNGTASTELSTSFKTRVAPHIPTGYIADSGWFVTLYGTNDLLGSVDTGAVIYARIKAMHSLVSSLGDRLTTACITVPPALAGGYTAPQETRRTDLNTLIRSGAGVDFDTLIDLAEIDAIESGYTGYWTDNYHPNQEGRRLIAGYVMARLAVGDVPTNTVRPVVTGIATQGSTLTSTTGTWTGATSYAYQWIANGTDIGAATSSTYVLQAAEAGLRVACRVTATNASGTAEITSQHTGIVS